MIAWRRILPSLLGLCITASGAEGKLQGGQASSVPFFAWAPRQGSYFVQGREPKISATGKDIASQISGLKSSTRPAEVVVLFTFSKMGSSHFNRLLAVGQGLNFLQAEFEGAASRLFEPYLFMERGDTGSKTLLRAVHSLEPSSSALKASLDGNGCTNLLSKLGSPTSQALFNNNILDVVVVDLGDFKPVRQTAGNTGLCIQAVAEYVDQQTKGAFAVAVSSETAPYMTMSFPDKAIDSAKSIGREPVEAEKRRLGSPEFRQDSYQESNPVFNATAATGPIYVTAPVLTGLIVGFLFLFISLVAVNCLMGVESPVRFGTIPLEVAKES